MRSVVVMVLALVLAPGLGGAETLTLEAVRDGTLIEDPAGGLANGSGTELFIGRTAQPAGSIRRALLRFDLTALPKQAVIEDVRLTVDVTQASSRPNRVRAHRVLDDWGEGGSFSGGGSGAPAAPGDATWIHRFFDPLAPAPPMSPASPAPPASPRSVWSAAGGDFSPAASAERDLGAPGLHSFTGAGLLADVQEWVRHPRRNFGWLLVGNESEASSARRIGSRENPFPASRPQLAVTYRRR